MELTVFYDKDKDIVVARPHAEITMDNIRVTVMKALELSNEYNCNYFLFDLRKCPSGQSLIEGFWGMQDMKQSTGLMLHHCCAVIYNPKLYPEERALFIENVVANRINPTLKMFKNPDEAMKWLREKRLNTLENKTNH